MRLRLHHELSHPVPELCQGQLSLSLASVPMDTVASKALSVQLLSQSVGLVLGPDKDQGLTYTKLSEHSGQPVLLIPLGHLYGDDEDQVGKI